MIALFKLQEDIDFLRALEEYKYVCILDAIGIMILACTNASQWSPGGPQAVSFERGIGSGELVS